MLELKMFCALRATESLTVVAVIQPRQDASPWRVPDWSQLAQPPVDHGLVPVTELGNN